MKTSSSEKKGAKTEKIDVAT